MTCKLPQLSSSSQQYTGQPLVQALLRAALFHGFLLKSNTACQTELGLHLDSNKETFHFGFVLQTLYYHHKRGSIQIFLSHVGINIREHNLFSFYFSTLS